MSRISTDEKLVFTRKTFKHRQCINVDWAKCDDSIVWTSLFYGPRSVDIWDSILSGISCRCIPEGSIIYTRLVLEYANERTIRNDPLLINESSETGMQTKVKSMIRSTFSTSYFAQMSRGQITAVYERYYMDLMMGAHPFLVSKDLLPDWKRLLRAGRFSGWKITKSLLDRISFVLFNHYDHGFEIVGRSFDPDLLLAVGEDVSKEYNLPLQIQDAGNPIGSPNQSTRISS